ncbi:hypothetical protein [Alkalihalobacillus pseudalcaliphilus]|uniref:hypothetical protein n=1 Tax=Alkalihalobacillus pseudalcaliphilus TaxID=79884 RepID=UPI00064D85C9|nr:hypothetical protein [Alkalihalobacillus pseudalcaliphilus]KMK75257.1 hypothetical protein AB990_17705 [Alkalihalobacillus pseudalcaliphilus]
MSKVTKRAEGNKEPANFKAQSIAPKQPSYKTPMSEQKSAPPPTKMKVVFDSLTGGISINKRSG